MSTVVERLSVELGVDKGNLEATLRRAGGATTRFADLADKALTGVVLGGFAQLGSSLTKFAGTAVQTFARTRLEIDKLAKTSTKLGIPTDRLAGLDLAAERSGVKIEQLRIGVQRATRRISENTAATAGALGELGLSARELQSLSPDQQLERIAEGFAKIDNQGDRVRVAFKLFDSEGVNLINTLQDGGTALRQAFTDAERFGLALSNVDAGRVERANDAINDVSKVSQGLARQFTAAFAPVVEGIAKAFVDSQGDIREWRSVFEQSINFGVKAIGFFIDAWLGVKGAILAVATLATKAFGGIVGSIESVVGAIDSFAQKFGIELVGGAEQAIGAFRREIELLGEVLDEDAANAFSNIGVISQQVQTRINEARRLRRAATETTDTTGAGAGNDPEAERQAELLQRERERQQASLAQLRKSLADQRTVIDLDYAQRLEQLTVFRDAELISETERGELLASLTRQRLDVVNALEERSAAQEQRRLEERVRRNAEAERAIQRERISGAQAAASTLGSIGQLILTTGGRQNKAAVAASKALAITQIGINTAIGASRAIADLGPIAGPVAAASIIAGGVASIASVAATQLGSSPVGGGGIASAGSGAVGGIGSGDVCSAVREAQSCGGGGREDETRLGSDSSRPIQIVQFGDADVEQLIREIKRKVDDEDILLFEGSSRQAQEVR
jgi:hypothetical protein